MSSHSWSQNISSRSVKTTKGEKNICHNSEPYPGIFLPQLNCGHPLFYYHLLIFKCCTQIKSKHLQRRAKGFVFFLPRSADAAFLVSWMLYPSRSQSWTVKTAGTPVQWSLRVDLCWLTAFTAHSLQLFANLELILLGCLVVYIHVSLRGGGRLGKASNRYFLLRLKWPYN